ncbi:MAG TPA: FAD:protein FMN transferase [Gaiellales bacterium]|nr:FAD:protein FMN transferase [Gaiellales bacterium]
MSAHVLRFRAMGCDVRVGGATAEEQMRIRALFDRHERRFSRFIDGSELNAVNAGAGRATRISREFADMLALSLWAAHQTGGAVDPTIGSALRAAGYDRDFEDGLDRPDPPAPAVAGCWQRIEVRDHLLRVPARVELDLNGVVKSQAVDDALACLAGEGWISAGGDVAARGAVDVELPGGGAVRLESGGLATSGCGRRTWSRAGTAQHHLIDPATGRPSQTRWQQVTVSGATCLDADVAAKAAFLLGDEGPDWLDERGLPGRFLCAGDQVVPNNSWRRSLEGAPVCT